MQVSVLSWGYPQIIVIHLMFGFSHYKPSSYWGTHCRKPPNRPRDVVLPHADQIDVTNPISQWSFQDPKMEMHHISKFYGDVP